MNVFETGVLAAAATGYPHVAALIPPALTVREAFGPEKGLHVFAANDGCAVAIMYLVHPEMVRRRHTFFVACQSAEDLQRLLQRTESLRRIGYRVVEGLRPESHAPAGGGA